MGGAMPNRDSELPPWLVKQLTDRAAKRGKGQQPILVGAIYRGKYEHVAFKAGGNDKVQIQVAKRGVSTSSEKYTVVHSANTQVRFIAATWDNIPPDHDLRSDDSDDVTYTDPLPETGDHHMNAVTRFSSGVGQTFNTLKGFFLSRIYLDAVNSQNQMTSQILHGCLNLTLPGCELGHDCCLTVLRHLILLVLGSFVCSFAAQFVGILFSFTLCPQTKHAMLMIFPATPQF